MPDLGDEVGDSEDQEDERRVVVVLERGAVDADPREPEREEPDADERERTDNFIRFARHTSVDQRVFRRDVIEARGTRILDAKHSGFISDFIDHNLIGDGRRSPKERSELFRTSSSIASIRSQQTNQFPNLAVQ